jgi:hypothetical protein
MKFPIPRKQALFYFYSKVKLVIELYKKNWNIKKASRNQLPDFCLLEK